MALGAASWSKFFDGAYVPAYMYFSDQNYNSELHEFQAELKDALIHDPKTMNTVKSASESREAAASDTLNVRTAGLTDKI